MLLNHPLVQLKRCFATSEFALQDFFTHPRVSDVQCFSEDRLFQNLTDVVFLATPAEVSLELAPKIIAAGKKVIDLSGAFRLKYNDYQKWYGFHHSALNFLAEAQYGLSPWAGPASSSVRLVANPGCYATAILMALIPLLKNGLIQADTVVIDAKSGATGAGRKASESMIFSEVSGECLPYKVGRHQHYPEIQEGLLSYAGQTIEAHFTTSLLPVRRGIIAGIYLKTQMGVSEAMIGAVYEDAYRNYDLVKVRSLKNQNMQSSLKKVVGTAQTHISYELQDSRLYIFACIDNLMKGAASQAIENLNRICDWPLETGLNHLEALI